MRDRYMLHQLYAQVYVWYVHGIYMVYTDVKMKAHGGCWLTFDVCIYMLYICYIDIIYIICKWYIPFICSPHQSCRYISRKFLMFSISHLFHRYIVPKICNVTGTEQNHENFTLLGIHQPYWWGQYITWIYPVYTMYISCIYLSCGDKPVKYKKSSWYILHGI